MTPTSEQERAQELPLRREQREQEGVGQRGQHEQLVAAIPGPQAGTFEGKLTLPVAPDQLNGMIANDKFCVMRWDALTLSWWRRPKCVPARRRAD